MVHGVAPPRPCQETKVRSPERRDAALGFHLAKPAVIGGDNDIARQHHLDADRIDDALYGGDNRLSTSICESEDVDRSVSSFPILGFGTEKLRHVQPSREVAAVGANDTNPIFVGLVQKREG